jgi:hypothetical protein
MVAALILSSTFAAGFVLGYGVRAWRSRRDRGRHLLYSSRGSSRSTTFGHARRAF